jgi:two-component system sensor histidine kinase KdpD
MSVPHRDTHNLTTADDTTPVASNAASGGERIAAIFEIARLLAAQVDLASMVSRFLSSLIETLNAAETGVLFLYEPACRCLTVRDAQGYDLDTLRQIRIVPGEGMSGIAFQTGRTGLYPTPQAIAAARANLTAANKSLVERATATLSTPLSAICVPLITGQTRVGALVLENRRTPDRFLPQDIPFLESVAQLFALAIENARLHDELQAVQAAEETDRFKAELISTLAHEMRTPLTSIKGFSTALLMEEPTFDLATQHEFLEIIDQECDVLTNLIHDLLESSSMDAGLLKLELQPVMLERLTREIIDDIGHRTSTHRFLIDYPADLPIVDADPRRIAQVLRNLLDNAIKYAPQGGMIVIQGQVRGPQVLISVSDEGIGIAPEHLNRLFEKFFRIDSGEDRHIVGSGLGLPIARTIIESHGGQIWAESQPGEGSTFHFTLPLHEEQPDE